MLSRKFIVQPIWIAAFFAIVVLARGLALLAVTGTNWSSDSLSFVLFGRLLSDFSTTVPLYLRTLPYLLLNSVTQSYVSPWPLLSLQAALCSIAIGLLVYSIAISNKILSILIGVCLSLDLVWTSSNRMILIEGPLSSLLLILIGFLILQKTRPVESSWALFLVGLFYGFCTLFRQSYLPMLACVFIFYFFTCRKARQTAIVVSGSIVLLASMSSFNALRTGDWRLWAQGGWYAEFPLFNNGYFSGENGPASKTISDSILRCGLTDKPEQLRFMVEGGVSQWDFEKCLLHQEEKSAARLDTSHTYENWYAGVKEQYAKQDWALEDRIANLISKAYFAEALPKNISRIPGVVEAETIKFLSGRTYTLSSQFWMLPLWKDGTPNYICPFNWCLANNIPSVYPFDGSGQTVYRLEQTLKPVNQLYIFLADHFIETSTDSRTISIVFFALFTFIFIFGDGLTRFIAFLVFFVISYTVLVNALSGIYILRYTSHLSTLYSMQGVLGIATLLHIIRKVQLLCISTIRKYDIR